MLSNLLEVFKPENNLSTILVGEVVDNHDPKKIGRCRIKIDGLNDAVPDDKLPWTHQLFPSGTGQESDPDVKSSYGDASIPLRDGIPNWKIPARGTKVVVIFPDNDIYSSFYIGELMYEGLDKGNLIDDYPETWGTIDKTNNRFWVDMIKGTVNFWHFTDTYFRIDKNGTINIHSVEDYNLEVEDNETVWVGGWKKQTIDKFVEETIGENYKLDVGTKMETTIGTENKLDVGTKMETTTGANYDVTAGGPINLKAPIINLN